MYENTHIPEDGPAAQMDKDDLDQIMKAKGSLIRPTAKGKAWQDPKELADSEGSSQRVQCDLCYGVS